MYLGAATLESTLNVSGNVIVAGTISGALGITGSSLQINDTITLNANGNITNTGHIYSATDNTYDLGASGNRWRNIYTADLHLKNDRGDWTLIEESNYLTVKNKCRMNESAPLSPLKVVALGTCFSDRECKQTIKGYRLENK